MDSLRKLIEDKNKDWIGESIKDSYYQYWILIRHYQPWCEVKHISNSGR